VVRQTVPVHTHHVDIREEEVRKRFVSWSEGEADREWAGLTLLDRHVPGLAPKPIRRDTERGAPVVVMSRVPGEPLGDSLVTTEQLHALTASIRRLFSVPVSDEIPERTWPPSEMRQGVSEWVSADRDLRECVDPSLVANAVGAARKWLATNDGPDDLVVDHVVALGDGNLANVMWDGTVCRLIDFEEFGRSDLAYEVADIVEHGSSRLRRLLNVDIFIEGLELSYGQHIRLTYFRRLFAAFWLVMLLPGNRGFERNPAGSTEDQARHLLALLDGH
jgi:hypothetical protein